MNPQPKLYHLIDIEGEKKLRHVNPFQAPSIYACRTDEEIENYNQFEQSAIANAKVLINPVPGKVEYSSDELREVYRRESYITASEKCMIVCDYGDYLIAREDTYNNLRTDIAFEYIGEKVEENEHLETDMKKASDMYSQGVFSLLNPNNPARDRITESATIDFEAGWESGEQAERSNQQKIIDGLSGVIESQKQTMEAMGKRLLMIEQVISGSSNPLTIRIGNILNPTAESAFNQPRFYTEADMLAMGEVVKEISVQRTLDFLHQNVTASIVYNDPYDYSNGISGAEVDYFQETAAELQAEQNVPDINLTQILKTINDGKV